MVIVISRFFHTAFKFCCIFMRRETKFLKICFPPSLGSIILPAGPKEFLFKGFFLGPVPVRLPPLKTPLDLQKIVVKPNVFSTFSFFGPSWFEYASKLLIYLNVPPARAGSTFLQIGAQSCSTKIQFFCLAAPLNAFLPIWAARQICKIPGKMCIICA